MHQVGSSRVTGGILHDIRSAVILIMERLLFPTDLQIRTMFGFGWVGGPKQNGCSDLKISWF